MWMHYYYSILLFPQNVPVILLWLEQLIESIQVIIVDTEVAYYTMDRVKTRVLIGLGEFVIKVQTHEWRNKLQSSACNHYYEDL